MFVSMSVWHWIHNGNSEQRVQKSFQSFWESVRRAIQKLLLAAILVTFCHALRPQNALLIGISAVFYYFFHLHIRQFIWLMAKKYNVSLLEVGEEIFRGESEAESHSITEDAFVQGEDVAADM